MGKYKIIPFNFSMGYKWIMFSNCISHVLLSEYQVLQCAQCQFSRPSIKQEPKYIPICVCKLVHRHSKRMCHRIWSQNLNVFVVLF